MKRPAPPIPPPKPTPGNSAGRPEFDEVLREDERRENRILFWLIFVAFALIVVVLVPVLAARFME